MKAPSTNRYELLHEDFGNFMRTVAKTGSLIQKIDMPGYECLEGFHFIAVATHLDLRPDSLLEHDAGLMTLVTMSIRTFHLVRTDLHPGNILVALDPPPGPLLSSAAYIVDRFKPFGWKVPSSWREPAIVLLDVGEPLSMSQGELGTDIDPAAPYVLHVKSAGLAAFVAALIPAISLWAERRSGHSAVLAACQLHSVVSGCCNVLNPGAAIWACYINLLS